MTNFLAAYNQIPLPIFIGAAIDDFNAQLKDTNTEGFYTDTS